MAFTCCRCGECCTQMGQVHRIEVTAGDDGFVLRNQYTGERTVVTIDPDKRRIWRDHRIFSRHPDACPFLRFDPSTGYGCCTVHRTRPEICRDFGCWRLLILDAGGNRRGRIMGDRHLASDDPALLRVWKTFQETHGTTDGRTWDRELIRILTEAGYCIVQ